MKLSPLFPLILPIMLLATSYSAEHRFYVGTSTKPEKSEGIYTGTFNSSTGILSPVTLAVKVDNPTFLAAHPKGKFLYAVSESKEASVNAYRISADGSLELINSQPSGGGGACHLSLDATGSCLMVANYGGGSIASFPVLVDGSIGERASFFQLKGNGPNNPRQEKPHAHHIVSDPNNKLVYVCDLGTDKIWIFQLDAKKALLTENNPHFGQAPTGGGPRHLVFHPKLPIIYANNELTRTVTTYSWNSTTGEIKSLQDLSTLPADAEAKGSNSEIVIHPNGQWLYVSNRVHDSIATYTVNSSDGTLTFLEAFNIEAAIPRHITLDPTAQWMISGGQQNDLLTVNPVDGTTGKLKATSQTLPVFGPACIIFVP